MGDFDKNQSASKSSEKKKLAIVGLLAVILIGVMIYHFTKTGPSQASASEVVVDPLVPVAAPVPEETAAQAKAALENDPTALLLRGTQNQDTSLENVPRNPFHMSDAWRGQLVHTTAQVVLHPDPVVQQTTAHTNAPPLKTDTFKLTMIFRRDGKLCAVINDQFVTVGGVVDAARVIDIQASRVTLESLETPGSVGVLTTDPKLTK